ncbi:glycosyltransferase [Limosilactobacillus fermentum]|uniref:glycosyltransferase n=1 Tax=Limosilactobacillus fermentum TaxID=1613 RepID=UPI003EC03996
MPVISFDVGGIGEVVTKDNGEIIPLNDFSLMRNKLLSNRVYPFEGEELLKEKFNWDYSAKKYMELFKKIGMKD